MTLFFGLEQRNDGTFTSLVDDNTVDSLEDVWYDLRIVADGPNVDVYRRVKDSDDPWTQILSVNNCTVTMTNLRNGNEPETGDTHLLPRSV